MVESAFNPQAYSRSKASGIWQFIPSTGKDFGLKQDWWVDNRRDVTAATNAALTYLQRLHVMFGTWDLALAAYNAGEGTVRRAIERNRKQGLPTDYESLPLPPEEHHDSSRAIRS
jgi:membrane-bound lytic murein transglycosylase D